MDSNGLAVQSALSAPCACPVIAPASGTVCPPLGYGGCEGGRCEEMPPVLPPVKEIPLPLPAHPSDAGYRTLQLGNWQFVGCTPDQERQLRRHLQDLCSSRVGGNTPLRRCLQEMCRNGFVIRCAPGWDPLCSGPEYRNCGYAPPPGNEIVLCPDAFDRQRCGCLGKTIVHEMAHVCGEGHPRAFQCEWYMYGPGTPPCPE